MIIEDVKRRPIDDKNDLKSPYYFRTRVVDITTDLGKFSTPARVVARTEFIARSEFGMSRALPRDLAIDFRIIIDEQMKDFTNDNKAVKKLIQKTKQFNDITRKAIFRVSMFQPAENVLSSMSPEAKIKFADLQADFLQIRLGADLITYPYLELPYSQYIEFIDTHYQRNEDFSTLFVLDMAMDPPTFSKIIEHLIKKKPIIIPLIYRDWEDTPLQHDIISSYFDEDQVAFFACQVPRAERESNTSNLHSVAFGGGFDLVSLEQSRGFGNNTKLDLTKIKFFSPQTLSLDPIENVLEDSTRNIYQEFNFASHNFNDFVYLREVLEGYEGAKIHPQKYQMLYYLTRLHEGLTSPQVFKNSLDVIVKKEVSQYIAQTSLKNAPMIKNRR